MTTTSLRMWRHPASTRLALTAASVCVKKPCVRRSAEAANVMKLMSMFSERRKLNSIMILELLRSSTHLRNYKDIFVLCFSLKEKRRRNAKQSARFSPIFGPRKIGPRGKRTPEEPGTGLCLYYRGPTECGGGGTHSPRGHPPAHGIRPRRCTGLVAGRHRSWPGGRRQRRQSTHRPYETVVRRSRGVPPP